MTQGASSTSKDSFDLFALLGVMWRGKWWILLCAIIGIVISSLYISRIAVPLYPAVTTIVLEGEDQQQVIGDIESLFAGGGTDTSAINTEIQVLRSRELLGRLVDQLNLTEDPEFSGLRDSPSIPQRINSFLTGRDFTPLEGEALRNRVIDNLITTISITNISQSLAFNIAIETTAPDKSAAIVNTLAEVYILNQITRKLDEATRAIEFLSQRTTELQDNVERLEQDLAARMEASDVIDATLLQAQNLQLRDLRERVADTQARIAEDRALRMAIEEADGFEQLLAVVETSADPRFAGIVTRFRAGRLSPEATQVALEGITSDVDVDIRRAQSQLASLQASAENLTAQITIQSEELIQMQQLEREADTARLLFQTFFTRLQEASVQQGLESPDARVLSLAVPRPPSSPRVIILLVLAAILGGFAGMAIAMIREWRFAGFLTPDELRSHTGALVMGTLPTMSVRGRKDVLKSMTDQPNSVFAEAVRNLRTSMLMANPDKEPQVILVTSSIPGEGKTTMSLALARYFGSLEGRKVLLVEADIRRQTLRAYVDEERPQGALLLDVLLGRAKLDDMDLLDPDIGVEVLMGSGGEYNAADLFESRRFRELIETLRGRYDHIIIDSPPVLAVPDARVLTRYADLCVFAVRWSTTTRAQVRQGLEMLASVGRPADGVILTQVDQRKMKGYGYGGQYGYDGASGSYYNSET